MVREVGGILDQLRVLNHSSLPEEKLDEIRKETRMLFLVGLGELYEVRGETDPDLLEIMKWAQIYDRLEETFERMDDIATASSYGVSDYIAKPFDFSELKEKIATGLSASQALAGAR